MNKEKLPSGFAKEFTDKLGLKKLAYTHYIGDQKHVFYINLDKRFEGDRGVSFRVDAFNEALTEADVTEREKRKTKLTEYQEKQAIAEFNGVSKPTKPAVQTAFKKPAVQAPPVTRKLEGEDPTMLDDDDLL